MLQLLLFNPDVAEIALTRCAYQQDKVHYDYEFIEDHCEDYCDDHMQTPPPRIGIPLTQLGLSASDDYVWLVDQRDERSIGSREMGNTAITWNPKMHPLTLMVSLFFERICISMGALLL